MRKPLHPWKGCVLLGLLLLLSRYCMGQSVKYLGIEQGLSNNAVTCIYKDHYGFMWFGTYDGLNKYDGTSVKVFRNIWGDKRSLNDNHVNKIAGNGNRIYVGTINGLVYYDYNESRFYPLMYRLPATDHVQKITGGITALTVDDSGTAYIGTDNTGFYIYDSKESVARQVNLLNAGFLYSVQALTLDRSGDIWVFVRNVGLCRLDFSHSHLLRVNTGLQSANSLLRDAHGNIWIGTDNGLYIYNIASHSLQKPNSVNDKLTSENIADIRFSNDGKLWIGTNGGGVNILDTVNHTIKYMVSEPTSASGMRSDAISMIYEDSESRKWIATLRGGVNILDAAHRQFKLIANNPFNKNSMVSNFSLSFCEDERHNLWIGTDGGGLSYWDRKNNKYTNYVHASSDASLASNFVVSIVRDQDNQIWIAMFSGGIDRFDKRTGRFIHYHCYNTATKVTDKNLWKLYLDSHNNLWAGSTRGGSLYRYNSKADKFELFDGRLTNIHALCEDHNGVLWAGDYSRLIKINQVTKKHQYISVKNPIRSLIEDKAHNLWIGTEGGGLLRYDEAKNTLTRFTQANGLPSNSILNVLIDDKNNLWASTYNGLTEYNTANHTFRNFYASDGLQSNQFNFNAALKLQSGELVFGGIKGFNIFYPDSIKMPVNEPQLKLTGLRINNKAIEGSTSYTGSQAIVNLQKITIPYNEATITIDYTAPEYSFPDKLNYAYYLEGWDHGWNNVGKLKTAYYTRLNEGNYTLRIRVSNTSGIWSSRQLVLQIHVLPPWYRTWWAYLLYTSVIATIVYWFWLYQIRQTRLKYEVQIANLNVEREKELNEKKLAFFTNVSHEFRTPLTLIINPIKDLLKKEHNKDNSELTTIYRNARRLLGLVDHLLLFRKTESDTDQLNLVNLDFAMLCYDVYSCFLHQAKIKNIRYNFCGTNAPVFIAADREKIEISLFNLISNAIKFTPEGGEINLRLREQDSNILFEVEDTGCGIAEGTGEKLFDKFYQIRDNTSLKTGFGIGLYLVKSFIKKHNGRITYSANALGGTTFTVELPKGTPAIVTAELKNRDIEQHLIDELLTTEISASKQAEEEVNNLELLISERQSVLIIDDNDQLRDYIKKMFKNGYKILEAETGEAGLEMIKKYLPDVVITDIVMGDLSGIELCRIIKQDTALSHIPVILLTGDPNPEIRLKGIEVGAVDFVSKPFEKDLLMARVKGILKDRRELQNYFYNEITLKSNTRNISEHHKDFMYNCIAVIENYLMDPNFDVKTIADEMGMSYSSLFKRIKAISGQSVNSFVRFVRLRKAAELMIQTNCNVNEAAFKTGFNDIKYFREHFVKQFGIKPSEFIKKHRTAFNKSYRLEEESFR